MHSLPWLTDLNKQRRTMDTYCPWPEVATWRTKLVLDHGMLDFGGSTCIWKYVFCHVSLLATILMKCILLCLCTIYYFYSYKTQQPLSYIFISVLHVSAHLSHLQVHVPEDGSGELDVTFQHSDCFHCIVGESWMIQRGWWIGKGFGSRRTWPNRDTIFTLAWRDWRKQREASVGIASVPAGIWTNHLPYTILDSYRHCNCNESAHRDAIFTCSYT
jgi:hypothetical protein